MKGTLWIVASFWTYEKQSLDLSDLEMRHEYSIHFWLIKIHAKISVISEESELIKPRLAYLYCSSISQIRIEGTVVVGEQKTCQPDTVLNTEANELLQTNSD